TSGGGFNIFAQGGLGGGDGGTVNLTAPRDIIIFDRLHAGPRGGDGNGAELSFTAISGVVAFGSNVPGSGLNGYGLWGGIGGSVTISSGATGNFSVGGGGAGAGVDGNILAEAGAGGGNGGTVTITTGGVLLFTNGGTISANAVTNGDTSKAFDGGKISLTATRMQVLDAGNFLLTANGRELGNGGEITVKSTGVGTVLAVGTDSAQLQISATGGTANSLGGNGGSVTIAATNLTVDPAGLNFGPLGLVGDGGKISLTAGANGTAGRLFVDGNLSANGVGIGNGGTVTLVSNSTKQFIVGARGGAPLNGVNGDVTAHAGGLPGKGGTHHNPDNGARRGI